MHEKEMLLSSSRLKEIESRTTIEKYRVDLSQTTTNSNIDVNGLLSILVGAFTGVPISSGGSMRGGHLRGGPSFASVSNATQPSGGSISGSGPSIADAPETSSSSAPSTSRNRIQELQREQERLAAELKSLEEKETEE